MKNRCQIRVQSTILNWSPLQVSLVAQTVKCLPARQETRVRSLGRKAPLEKEMATRSSILASDMTERLHFHLPTPLKGKETEGRAWLDSVTASLDIE